MLMELSENDETLESRNCEKHGAYQAKVGVVKMINRKFETGCPSCATEKRQSDESKNNVRKIGETQDKFTAALTASGIPKRFLNRTFDNFEQITFSQKSNHKKVKTYADNFAEHRNMGTSLIFSGDVGTGKNHLAAALANQVIKNKFTVCFTTVRRAIRKVKSTWSGKPKLTEEEVLDQFIRVDLLVLDELGVQFDSDAERLILFDILNARYENMKPTVIMSNLPLAAPPEDPDQKTVKSILGIRLTDRLREDEGNALIFQGDSYRGKKRAAS